MSDDDAQIDGGDTGQGFEDAATDLIGDGTDAEAVFTYGTYCLWLGFGTMVFWILLNNNNWVVWYKAGLYTKMYVYIPTGLAWIAVSMFDGKLMRQIYKDIVALSILAPFWKEWYDFGVYLLLLDGGTTLMYWIGMALWFCLTVFEGVIQLLILPKVFAWADEAPTLDNGAEDNDGNLLANLINFDF